MAPVRLRVVDGDADFQAAVGRPPEPFGDGGRIGQRIAGQVRPQSLRKPLERTTSVSFSQRPDE